MALQVHIRIIIENQVMHAKKAVKFAIQVLLEVEQLVVNMEPMPALQRNLVSLFSFSIFHFVYFWITTFSFTEYLIFTYLLAGEKTCAYIGEVGEEGCMYNMVGKDISTANYEYLTSKKLDRNGDCCMCRENFCNNDWLIWLKQRK